MKGALEKLAKRVPGVESSQKMGVLLGPRRRKSVDGHTIGGSKVKWINMVVNLDIAWKGPCVEILNYVSLLYSMINCSK